MRKFTLILASLFLSLGAWAQAVGFEVSETVDNPEHQYYITNGNNVRMAATTAPTQNNPGKFAFFATGEGAYKIYSIGKQQWVSYDKTSTTNNTKDFAKLVNTQDDAEAWKITASSIKGGASGYTVVPFNSDGSVSARYWNWNGGVNVGGGYSYDDTRTVGIWKDNATSDAGSGWIFTSEINYTLTDVFGNTYTGYYHGEVGVDPTFSNATGCTFTNGAWDGNNYTATVTFPFPMSGNNKVNEVMICPFNSNAMYYVLSGTEVRATKTVPVEATKSNYLWAVYPSFEGTSIVYTIKSVASGKYVYTSATSRKHDDNTVTVGDEATQFILQGENVFKLVDKELYFSTNSSSTADQPAGVWNSAHGGTKNKIRVATSDYVITDNFGNEFKGTYDSFYGHNPLTLTAGGTLANGAWSNNTYSATVTYAIGDKFPVSSGSTQQPTLLAIYPGQDRTAPKLLMASDTDVKVKASEARPETDDYKWALYPNLQGSKIVYAIKNVAADSYVYSVAENNTSKVQNSQNPNIQGTVVLSETPSYFEIVNNSQDFQFAGKDKLYLSINSDIDADVFLGVHHTKHGGSKIAVPATFPVAKVVYSNNDTRYKNTLQDAVSVVAEGSTLVLLANTDETVVLPKGVKLDKNGFDAPKVKEAPTVAEVATLAALQDALANSELPIIITKMIEIPAGETVELNLNGKTVNVAWENEEAGKHIYAFTNNGTLEIKGEGTINTRGIFNYGNMTLTSGTINAIDCNGGYGVRNYAGSFTMNGGTIATTHEDGDVPGDGYDACPVRVDEGATFTMNDGVINNVSNFTVAVDNYGKTIIKGGKATTIHTTLANSGTMIIEGGEFTCNGLEGVTAHVIWASAGSTTINGGTFDGKDNYNGFNVDASEDAVVTITGGNFLPVHSGSLYGKGTIAVSGGTFFDKVADERCAEGFVCEANADGTYGIITGYKFVDGEFDAYTNDKNITVAKITYTRTLIAGIWNPIYLPFEAKLSTELYDVAEFTSAEGETVTLTKIEGATAALDANTAYVIRPKNEEAKKLTITLENATLEAVPADDEDKAKDLTNGFFVKGNYSVLTGADLNTKTDRVVGTNGNWGVLKNTSTLKPFRLILTIPAGVDASAISMRVEGEDATSIENLGITIEGDVIFDLMGRRVESITEGGIYIVNGKKIVF